MELILFILGCIIALILIAFFCTYGITKFKVYECLDMTKDLEEFVKNDNNNE